MSIPGPGNGYRIMPDNQMSAHIANLRGRVQKLETRAGGAMTVASLLSQVRLAIANLTTGVATAFAALIASGFSTPGTITAGGLTTGGLIKSPATYSNPITTSFRAVWVTSVDGQFGFNLSSREFKQDIADFVPDLATIRLLRLVTFRYIAAVESEGDDAEYQIGLIAEEVHDLGLHWLVEYEDGRPIGIKLHLVAMADLALTQDHERRLDELESFVRLSVEELSKAFPPSN